jgi:hypothetical protein
MGHQLQTTSCNRYFGVTWPAVCCPHLFTGVTFLLPRQPPEYQMNQNPLNLLNFQPANTTQQTQKQKVTSLGSLCPSLADLGHHRLPLPGLEFFEWKPSLEPLVPIFFFAVFLRPSTLAQVAVGGYSAWCCTSGRAPFLCAASVSGGSVGNTQLGAVLLALLGT